MNTGNLHALITRYEENYAWINDAEHDEIFKWKAVQGFRRIWFSEAAKEMSFAQRFHEAMKDSSIMINNSIIAPAAGVVKLAELYPEQVETLFNETLFSGETNPKIVQNLMDRFIEEMEMLRQKKFPSSYRYKQERHAASCYMAFFQPEDHFVYRCKDAEEFAKYLEFGKDLGSGRNFNLENYYELAELVVLALKEHPSLLKKHKALISASDEYYKDESLHLMAFDLMYCSRCYNFFSGLTHASKKDSIKAYALSKLREKEEQDRMAMIRELEDEIHTLEVQLEEYECVSLVDVEVTQKNYGIGTIVAQKGNEITVRFSEIEKSFRIHEKYSMRPTFENDDEIVKAFTIYSDLCDKKTMLEKKLKTL